MPAAKHSLQEQEQIILDAAACCIEETTLLDFTMAAIGKKAGCSMGSLYKHVQSKEDVLVALATKMFEQKTQVFAQILALPLSTPEKVMAIFLRDPRKSQTFCFGAQLEAISGCHAIQARASHLWRDKMAGASQGIEVLFKSCWWQAVEAGELRLDADIDADALVEELNLAAWSLHSGMNQVLMHQYSTSGGQVGKHDCLSLVLDQPMVKVLVRLLGSYDWQRHLDETGITKAEQALIQAGLR